MKFSDWTLIKVSASVGSILISANPCLSEIATLFQSVFLIPDIGSLVRKSTKTNEYLVPEGDI